MEKMSTQVQTQQSQQTAGVAPQQAFKDYKDKSKREAVWDKFCEDNNLNKDACQKWLQSQCTLFGKVTHMKLVLRGPQLTEWQKWTRDNFHFLRGHIVRHLKGKSEFRASKGFPSQCSSGLSIQKGDSAQWNRSRILLVQNPADMSHLDTHTSTPRSRGISVTSSFADSDFQSALVESRRGITELKDIAAKKLTDDKADNPQLGFCDFLKVEVVQLTSDTNDEFQQEIFNLLMRLKRSDKQQRYHHCTAAYSRASNQYPVSDTQMQAPPQVPQGHPQQQHLQHS